MSDGAVSVADAGTAAGTTARSVTDLSTSVSTSKSTTTAAPHAEVAAAAAAAPSSPETATDTRASSSASTSPQPKSSNGLKFTFRRKEHSSLEQVTGSSSSGINADLFAGLQSSRSTPSPSPESGDDEGKSGRSKSPGRLHHMMTWSSRTLSMRSLASLSPNGSVDNVDGTGTISGGTYKSAHVSPPSTTQHDYVKTSRSQPATVEMAKETSAHRSGWNLSKRIKDTWNIRFHNSYVETRGKPYVQSSPDDFTLERQKSSRPSVKDIDIAGDKKFFIKIESLENGSDLKEVKIFDVNLDIDVADLTAKCVKRFCKLEEWRYALYHPQTRQWLYNGSSLRDYSLREWSVLQLVVKTSEYFEGETLTFHKALMGSTAPSTLSVSTFYRDPGFMNPNAPKFALEKKVRKETIYLVEIILRSDGCVLQSSSGLLPMMPIVRLKNYRHQEFPANGDDFLYILKLSKDWDDQDYMAEVAGRVLGRPNSPENAGNDQSPQMPREASPPPSGLTDVFRRSSNPGGSSNGANSPSPGVEILKLDESNDEQRVHFSDYFDRAIVKMTRAMFLRSPGHLYCQPLYNESLESYFVVCIKSLTDTEAYADELNKSEGGLQLRWREVERLDWGAYSQSWGLWSHLHEIYNSSRNTLSEGLYVGLFHAMSTAKGFVVMVPKLYPEMVPVMKVRDNAQVTAEEWDFVRGKTTDEPFTDSPADKLPLPLPAELEEFGKNLALALDRLKRSTEVSIGADHLYDVGPIDIDEDRSVRMIAFVRIIGFQDNALSFNTSNYFMYPLTCFEILHNDIYKNNQFRAFRRSSMAAHREPSNSKRTKSPSAADDVVKQWRAQSWTMSVVEWHRTKTFNTLSKKHHVST